MVSTYLNGACRIALTSMYVVWLGVYMSAGQNSLSSSTEVDISDHVEMACQFLLAQKLIHVFPRN